MDSLFGLLSLFWGILWETWNTSGWPFCGSELRLTGASPTTIRLSHDGLFNLSGAFFQVSDDCTPWTAGFRLPPNILVPATIIHTNSTTLDEGFLRHTLESYTSLDDVWQESFLSTIIVNAVASQKIVVTANATRQFESWNTSLIRTYGKSFPPGPFVITRHHLCPVLRLYPDTQEAFVSTGLVSAKHGRLPIQPVIDQFRYVAVPSRLYSRPSESMPLAGLRVGVKDVIDVSGYRTGASNRAFYELYSSKSHSAPVVERLIELGAVIVGKTKSTQFALGEEPTADWVDYFCPFNPRGDGYQTTEGSSAGSGAAIAAYDWLDLTIGSDTTGSVRLPAAFQGVFGFRPSTRTISQDGMVAVSPVYDTAGFLARDIAVIAKAMKSFYGQRKNTARGASWPTRILYPSDFFPFPQDEAQVALDSFVSDLEQFLSIERIQYDLKSTWKLMDPSGTGQDLEVYMNHTISDILTSDSFKYNSPFVRQYKDMFGQNPFISPLPRWTWEYGEKVSEEEVQEALKRKEVFRKWFNDIVLESSNETCSRSLMVFPFGDPAPRYRDVYRDPPSYAGFSWRQDFLSPVAELPDLIIPIGLYSYYSRITQTKNFLPVSIAVIAASGCDAMLLEFAEEMLVSTGLATTVKAGRYPFDIPSNTIEIG